MPTIAITKSDILNALESTGQESLNELLKKAARIRNDHVGNTVYLRGLIEFSNICSCDCYYCGLRKSNFKVQRYRLNKNEIVALALQAYTEGHHSICLQSGEIKSEKNLDFLADVVETIKNSTSKNGSKGLGITLSVGELTYQEYKKLYEAGAHRYLLRIESSNPVLFKKIHPPSQLLEKRLECLAALKDIGYQVGTGVMIGLPGQTNEDLLQDLKFFASRDIDMLGMGPYIPHPDTPLALTKEKIYLEPYYTTLKMIALARILMPDINMVASTALQSIHPEGLSMGLKAGANIVMPILTPVKNRKDYYLYADKKFTPFNTLYTEIKQSGFEVGLWKWGDSRHYFSRNNMPYSNN